MTTSAWHRWHRTAGILAAVIVLLLSVTGLILNHSDALDLNHRYAAGEWLLAWYDIDPKDPPLAFQVGDHWVVRIGERLYFDRGELSEGAGNLIGAVHQGDNIVVALGDRLLILSAGGDPMEVLTGAEGVPAGMKAIGVSAGGELVIRGAHGDYLVALDALEWDERNDDVMAEWAAAAPLPPEIAAHLLQLYRGKGLSLERVLVDLHSGRIFGVLGAWIVDLATIAFVFLAASGAWLWLKRPSA